MAVGVGVAMGVRHPHEKEGKRGLHFLEMFLEQQARAFPAFVSVCLECGCLDWN